MENFCKYRKTVLGKKQETSGIDTAFSVFLMFSWGVTSELGAVYGQHIYGFVAISVTVVPQSYPKILS